MVSRWRGARLCVCNSRIDLLLADLLSSSHSSGNLRGDRDPLNASLWRRRKRDCHSRVVMMRPNTSVKSRLTKARRAFSNPGLRVIILIKAFAPRIGGHSGKEPCRNCTDYNNRCEHPAQDTKSDVSRDEPERQSCRSHAHNPIFECHPVALCNKEFLRRADKREG